ncbi:carbohydrate-binding protein [Orenia marismortui]|uniref:Carbohydrate/starch-binding protein with CBM21 domain n=1 Tax=Orenia marismortui TaxID=46469 RepID=A0A4R8H852_9FIRM|nr:carbohydrate-binding protein [Orenia marismortui]TDX51825.1 carbohydrate/starch-binding protein with CBM21 domain [Orenia marismortui]
MFKTRSSIALMLIFILMLAVNIVNAQEVKVGNGKGAKMAEDSNPIDFYYAKVNLLSEQGISKTYNASGYIGVKNNSFPTKVTIHYTYDIYSNSNWKDVDAKYMGVAPDGNHIWHFETPKITRDYYPYFNYDCQFAIKYESNGQVYWDNNHQQNYLIKNTNVPGVNNIPILLKRSRVILDKVSRENNTIVGSIDLKNLDYSKDVKVVYTLDNWQTSNTVSANYNISYDNNIENWKFIINNIPNDTKVKYYIDYKVNGTHYYDNNFGTNYKI